jgi:hypothetical protein
MGPLLIPGILSGISSLAGTIANAVPTKADRENKKRIAELERLKLAEQLGLSEQERATLYGEAAQMAQAERDALQGAVLQNLAQGAGSGEALRQATRAAEAAARTDSQIGMQVARQDLAMRQALLDELSERTVMQSDRARERLSAAMQPIVDIADIGAESFVQEQALRQLTGQAGPLSPAQAARRVRLSSRLNGF